MDLDLSNVIGFPVFNLKHKYLSPEVLNPNDFKYDESVTTASSTSNSYKLAIS